MRKIKFEYIFFDLIDRKYIKKVFEIKDLEFMNFENFMLENLNFKFIARRQYTGLKDADGVEIYEGDLIQLYYITPFGGITNDLEDDMFEIKFLNGTFGYQNETSFVPLEKLIEKHSGEYVSNCGNKVIYGKTLCKTIGNIYENKD